MNCSDDGYTTTPLGTGLGVGDGVGLGVDVGDALDEDVGDADGLAPVLAVALGEALGEPLDAGVGVGEGDGPPEAVLVGAVDGEPEGDGVATGVCVGPTGGLELPPPPPLHAARLHAAANSALAREVHLRACIGHLRGNEKQQASQKPRRDVFKISVARAPDNRSPPSQS